MMPNRLKLTDCLKNKVLSFKQLLLITASLGIALPQFGLITLATDLPVQVIKKTLASGQAVYIKEDHRQPIVTIDTWVKTGSVHESTENNGVSHFLEHLLFKGTSLYKPGEIDRILESRGAMFNAATSDDFTHYYIKTSPLYLEEAIRLHGNMLTQASIPEKELPQERKVVQEEINRANDNPERQLFVALTSELFKGHGYAMDTLGPKHNIATIKRQSIMDYYHYWYQPENLNTVIVGDIDPNTALTLVEKAFAQDTFATAPDTQQIKPVSSVPSLSEPKSIILESPKINQSYVAVGLLAPGLEQVEDAYALDIAMMALDSGKSSRLYQALKEKTSLVTSVSASNVTQKYSGLLFLEAKMPSENREQVKQMLLSELMKLKHEGITFEELEKAKTQYLKDFIFENETTDGTASSIGYHVTIGKLDNYLNHKTMVKQVTLEKVKNALERYVKPEEAVIVELLPSQLKVNTAQETKNNIALLKQHTLPPVQLSGAPAPCNKTIDPRKASEPYKTVLPNGITLVGRPLKDSATVAFNIFIKGGQSVEPIPGVASLLSSVMLQGTKSRDLSSLQQELDGRGMSLSVSASDDYVSVSGSAIHEDFAELMLLLQDAIENPLFSEQEIEKKKKQIAQAIDASQDSPSSIVFENLALTLYPDHPYGNVGKRVKEALPQITRDDVLAYYKSYFSPKNMVVTVVGNFEPKVTNSYFGSLFANCTDCSEAVSLDIPAVETLASSQEIVVERKSLSATWLAQGWLMPSLSNTKEYATFKLIHSLIGQGMSSRLFTALREKQGLAYVVGSVYPTRMEKSYFSAYIGTDPVNLKKVRRGFDAEINRLKTTLVSANELQDAKSKLIGSFALEHDSNSTQAFYLGLYETLGKGYEFDQDYPQIVQSITSEDILNASKAWLSQSSVSSIVQPETIIKKN